MNDAIGRPPASTPARLALGERVLDLHRMTLLDASGAPVDLRPQVWAVLEHLARNAGRVVTREELLDAVWPGLVVTDGSITQAISDVRAALGDAEHRIVKTVQRRGYMLLADAASAGAAAPPAISAAAGADQAAGSSKCRIAVPHVMPRAGQVARFVSRPRCDALAPAGTALRAAYVVEVWPQQRRLFIDGAEAELGGGAFDLLLALVERRDRVVGSSELFGLVWPGLVVEESNLQLHLSALRRLLGSHAIATIPGRGYRLMLETIGGDLPSAGPPHTADTVGNLPLHTPPLIGRDAVLQDLLARLDEQALVSVVGAGGIGKTALALAAAVGLRGRFRDGAWWVDLAPLSDPGLLAQTVAQALRITLTGTGSAQQQLVSVLRWQRMLVVLDNCEQVVDAVSHLAAAIAAEAPGVRVLATSQELLNVTGESVYRIEPLSLPAVGETPQPDAHGAVALFVERARAADPHFALTPGNAAAVAEICRRLDGLPLAVELAAARVRLLGVDGLRERLGERFKLLAGGARTALRRHQTLYATIDWSHALLKPDEQAVLRRLSVFVGGFSLPLAQHVCAEAPLDEWAVLEVLGTLVDKSLVAVEAGEPVRYRLLETTRAYALERLAEADETARALKRHAHAVRDLYLRTDDERYCDAGTLEMGRLMQRLVPELDNWRAAFDWACGDGAEPGTAIALAGAGAQVLRELGLTQEALQRMLPLRVTADGAEPPYAAAFWLRLALLGWNGRLPKETLLDAAERAQRRYRAIGARRRLIIAMCYAVRSLADLGELDAADVLVPEIVAMEVDADPAWLRSVRLNVQAVLRNHQGRFAESVALLSEMRELLRQTPGEDPLLVGCWNNLCFALNCLQRYEEVVALAGSTLERARATMAAGYLFFQLLNAQTGLGRVDDAKRTLREALPVWRRDALLVPGGFSIGSALALCGRHADAVRLEAAALLHMRRTGSMLVPVQQLSCERIARALDVAGVARADAERWRHEGESLDEARVAALCEAAVAELG